MSCEKLHHIRIPERVCRKIGEIIADGGAASETEVVLKVLRRRERCPHVCACEKFTAHTADKLDSDLYFRLPGARRFPKVPPRIPDDLDKFRVCLDCITSSVVIRPVVYDRATAEEIAKYQRMMKAVNR